MKGMHNPVLCSHWLVINRKKNLDLWPGLHLLKVRVFRRQILSPSLPPNSVYDRAMDAHVMAYCFPFGQHSGDDQVNAGTRAVPSTRGHLFPFKGFGSGFIISSFGRTVRPFYREGLSGRGHGRLVSPSCGNSF